MAKNNLPAQPSPRITPPLTPETIGQLVENPTKELELRAADILAYDYLENHDGRVNISEVYAKGGNPYKMPRFEILASEQAPLGLDELKKCNLDLGNTVINKLTDYGKVKENKLISNVEFSAVAFKKHASGVFSGT